MDAVPTQESRFVSEAGYLETLCAYRPGVSSGRELLLER